jgi:[ribosomal protein S5]-alanine N-acetyltransferase
MTTIDFSMGQLRPWQMEDVPRLATLANEPSIAANLRDGFPHPYNETHARNFIANVASNRSNHFFAITGETGLMGGIGIVANVDVHRFTAELGYWLGEPYQRKGVMTEAVRAIVSYGFETLDLDRISAAPYAPNVASRRVLEKAGFVLEGILRHNAVKNNVRLDQALYARLHTDKDVEPSAIPLHRGRLRLLHPGELNALKDLYRFLHDTDMAPLNVDAEKTAWEAMQRHDVVRCYGVWLEDRLVASCVLNILPNLTRGSRPYGLIENVITHPEFRRRGIGQSMMQAVVEVAWQENCYKVMLLTGHVNEDVFRFYESCGFDRKGKQGFIIRAQ